MQLGIEEVVSLSLSENLHARTFVRNVRLNLELSASLRLGDGNCEIEIGAPMSGRAGLVINAKSWHFVKNSEEN